MQVGISTDCTSPVDMIPSTFDPLPSETSAPAGAGTGAKLVIDDIIDDDACASGMSTVDVLLAGGPCGPYTGGLTVESCKALFGGPSGPKIGGAGGAGREGPSTEETVVEDTNGGGTPCIGVVCNGDTFRGGGGGAPCVGGTGAGAPSTVDTGGGGA